MKLNKSRGWLIATKLGIVGILCLIAAACGGLPTSNTTNTPTATSILMINETATPPESSTPGSASPVAISGTYEQHSDVTNTSDDGFARTVIDLVGTFKARAGSGNTMTGEAQLTFKESYDFQGAGCRISWSTGVDWSPQLSGTYQKNADGSIAIALLADPSMSPPYSEKYVCAGETPANAPWPAAGGTLVNGVFDFRQDFPMTNGATGTNYYTWHMELVPGQ